MAATRRQTKGGLKASGIIYLLIGIVCVVIGIITLIANSSYMIKGECLEMDDYLESGVYPVGEYVKMDVHSLLGNYAETKHTTNGIPTGTDQYYVLWLDNDTFISIKVKSKKDIETLNKIVDETWSSDDWYSTTSFEATGKLKNISNSELRGFYNDFFDEFCEYMGIEKSELTSQFTIKEIEIDCTDSRSSLWGLFALFCGLGVLLILVALATLKKAKNFDNAPAVDYSNVDYTPVDTTAYNPVDTSAPYDPTGADLNGSSDANLNNTDPGMTLNGGQDPNNFQ